jgi:hypothetical protein
MNIDKQKGVSLIMVFFIMIIVLSIVLSISILLYREVKVIRNMGNSVVSLYAADSGIEKVLYYDRQVKPTLTDGSGAVRGLCSMVIDTNGDGSSNPYYCSNDNSNPSLNTEHSIYCNNEATDPLISIHGCDPDLCNNCQISFKTFFDEKTYYDTMATIDPSGNFTIMSKGTFGDAQRQIQIFIAPTQ